MSIKHLKIFIKVYQNKNITKASKELHMVQPAVSRSIQELEKYYGVNLFDRINHKIYPTDKADELYSRAVQIIDAIDDMEEMIMDNDGKDTIYVGGTMTIGNFVLPIVVSEFKKLYPNVKVRVTISNSSDIQKKILDNELDFAIVEENVQADYLETEFFYSDNMCLIYGENHELGRMKSITMKDLSKYPFLLREKGSAARTYIEHFLGIHDLVIDPLWESTSTQALINAAAKGIGISILPEKLVRRAIDDGCICTRKINDEEFKRNIYFIWHKQKVLSDAMEKFKGTCVRLKKERKI